MKLSNLLKSRKFWAAVVGLVVLVLKEFYPDLPIDAEQLANLIYIIAAYILGVAIEDGLRLYKSGYEERR